MDDPICTYDGSLCGMGGYCDECPYTKTIEDTMTTQLKPCPFCGKVGVSVHEGTTFRWWYAECDHCGAQAGEVRRDTLAIDQQDALRRVEKDAIAEWNRREAPQ